MDDLTAGAFGTSAAFSTPAGQKLLATIADGVGLITKPINALSEGAAKLITARLERSEHLIKQDTGFLLEDRARLRLNTQELKRQGNLESIAEKAMNNLPPNDVNDKQVDPDWASRFLNLAKDVSKEEAQYYWAKLLAGEVKKPGSFSLRSLEALKLMTKEDLDNFVNILDLAIKVLPYNIKRPPFVPVVNGLITAEFAETGLLLPIAEHEQAVTLLDEGHRKGGGFEYRGLKYKYINNNPETNNNLGNAITHVRFTRIGMELAQLDDAKARHAKTFTDQSRALTELFRLHIELERQ